jgi:hypothetical protein
MSAAELGSTDAVAAIGVFHGDALSNGTGPPEPEVVGVGVGVGVVVVVVVVVVGVGVGVVEVVVVVVVVVPELGVVCTTSWAVVTLPASRAAWEMLEAFEVRAKLTVPLAGVIPVTSMLFQLPEVTAPLEP